MLRGALSEPALSSIQSCYFCVPLVILSDFCNNIIILCSHWSSVSFIVAGLDSLTDLAIAIIFRAMYHNFLTDYIPFWINVFCSEVIMVLWQNRVIIYGNYFDVQRVDFLVVYADNTCLFELFSHPSLASVRIDSLSFTSFQLLLHCHNSDCILTNSSNNILY